MSLTLEIIGNGQTQTHVIQHAICRIGSAPSMELCIPGIAGHAVTVRSQGEKCLVYNRSTQNIHLHGHSMGAEQTSEWREGQTLKLNESMQIRLLPNKIATNAAKAAVAAQQATSHSEESLSTPRSFILRNQRTLLIGCFFVVFAFILFSGESNDRRKAMLHDFSSTILPALQEAELKPQGGKYRQLRIELQNALLRPDLHREAIANVQNILATRSSAVSNSDATDDQIRKFLAKYL